MEKYFMNISSAVISQSLNAAAFHEAAEQPGAKARKWSKQLICVSGPKSLTLPLVQQTLLCPSPAHLRGSSAASVSPATHQGFLLRQLV